MPVTHEIEGAPLPICFYRAFENIAQTEASMNNLAVVMGHSTWTYEKLNAAADKLAWELYQRFESEIHANLHNQRPGEEILIGIALPRSPEMVISLLAVMKAGLAYVPLDIEAKNDLLQYWLADSGAKLIICDESFSDARLAELQSTNMPLPERFSLATFDLENSVLPEEQLSKLRHLPIASNTLAYVMYTSGSTDKPKGVAVLHRGFMPCLVAFQEILEGVLPEDRIAQLANIAFDASLAEILLALGSGATLVIVPNDPFLTDHFIKNNVTICMITPRKLENLDPKTFPNLRGLFIIGEKFDSALSDLWLNADLSRIVINGYGLTETTICTTLSRCAIGTPLNIGKAIYGLKILLRPLTPEEENEGVPIKLSELNESFFISDEN